MNRLDSSPALQPQPEPAVQQELARLRQEVLQLESRQAALLQSEAHYRALAASLGEGNSMLQAMRHSEERYRQVVEHLGEGMIVIQDGHVVFANTQASGILRVPQADMLGSQPVDWLHPDDRAGVAERIRRRQAGEAAPTHNEFRRVDSDGALRWIDSHSVAVQWEGRPATMSFFSDVTERKAMTMALQRSEERYKAVIEHVGEGMIVIQDEKVVFVNSRAAAIARLPREDMLTLGFLHSVHPDDHAMVLDRQRRRLAGEQVPDRYELRLLHADGSITWLEIGVTLVPWDGKPATLTFFSDVNHRKNLEAQLRTTLEERETILQSSIMGIAFLTPAGRFRWANHAMRTIFGGENLAQIDTMEPFYLSREQYLQVGGDVARCVRAGKDYQSELQMRRHDGTQFWALLSGKAVNPKDTNQGTVWVIMDITQRKELEVALQRTSNEREAILNSTLVGISYNRNRCIEWVNDKYVEMTGFKREELMGQSSRLFYDSEEAYLADGRLTQEALLHDGTYINERQIKRRDGTPFWVVLSGRCVIDRNPDAGVIWTMLDITARRQAEEDIRTALQRQTELNELRSRFVSMTSHEFRTPLATILSSAELLRYYKDRMSADEQAETLASIETAVHRMTRMLERVLLIGKTEAQMLEFAPSELDLDALCRTMVSETLSQAAEASRRVRYEFRATSAMGLFDEKLLRHIFSNLLSNAIKYSPQGGQVLFSVSEGPEGTVFEVSDEGIGIPASEIPHLFESFHRASNVGNIPGTGLGLSIVKKSVDLHGGTITVCSTPGHGTQFTVTL